MRKLFFVGVFLVGLFCSASALLAKENGTEDCDAVFLEQVLKQAREALEDATANTSFLPEVKPTLNDIKKIVEEIVVENFRRQDEFFAKEKCK